MKISIITVCFNSEAFLANCIESVLSQTHDDIEYIIVDGGSSDATLSIINRYRDHIANVVSEVDEGIYDALNKGFSLSTGNIIGILHSDDVFYNNESLSLIANAFMSDPLDYVYGDIQMFNSDQKLAREYRPGPLKNGLILATQIPHPALFLSRKLLSLLDPPFDSSYRIAADLKQQLLFANIHRSEGKYLPTPIVKMRVGGTSTANLRAYLAGWIESRRAWNEVHGSGGLLYVLRKVVSKFKGLR